MSIYPLPNKIIRAWLASILVVSIQGCAFQQNPCENILEVKQQRQECERLRKTMGRSDYPQQALTAKLRYEEACTNLRYYRDEYDTICKKDGTAIGESPQPQNNVKRDN